MINVSYWDSVDGSRNEINLISVNILNDHNVFLGKEMESQFVYGISQDGFLDQKNIATGGSEFLNQIKDVFSFFFQNSIHGSIIMNNDIIFQIGLRSRQLELDETNLCVLNSRGTTCEVRDLLVNEDKTVNQFTFINSFSELFRDTNVSQVNINIIFLIDDAEHCIDCHWG